VELPALEGARLAVAEWAGGARVVVVMVALGARATAVDAVEMEVVLAVAAATATTPRLAATRPVRAESRHLMTEEWLRRRSCTLYGHSADGVSRRRPGRAIARRVAICRPGDFRWHRKDRSARALHDTRGRRLGGTKQTCSLEAAGRTRRFVTSLLCAPCLAIGRRVAAEAVGGRELATAAHAVAQEVEPKVPE